MSKKSTVQFHMLYTTSEFLYDRIIIDGGKTTLTIGQEDYSNSFADEDYSNEAEYFHVDNDIEWYEESIKHEYEETLALASREGLQKTFVLLDWLGRLDKMISFLRAKKPELFNDSNALNISIFIEVLDTAIQFEKVLIGGWNDLLKKYGDYLQITRFSLIGKNHIIKRNILEIELPTTSKLSELTIKNIDCNNIRIRGYAKNIKITGVKSESILLRPNSSIYEIKKDRANLVIGNSEIGKLKVNNYEENKTIFSSIRVTQSSISGYIQISGVHLRLKGTDKGGLKFEYSSFQPEAALSIHNSEVEHLSSIKSTLNRLDIRSSELSSVFFSESNIQLAQFSGISGRGIYSLMQKNNKPDHSELMEYYRNFKHSHDELGNKVEANKFYQKEMGHYRKALWTNGSKFFAKPWQKIIISYLNDEISEYGLNWWRALLFYILFCFFTYIAHELIRVHNLEVYNFLSGIVDFWQNNWNNIARLNWNNSQFNEFAGFLNPLPDLKEEKTILGLLFSTLKILIVYQIVVALRRISQR